VPQSNRRGREKLPAVLATGPPASFQFPGGDFIRFDQCGLTRGAFDPSHGSRNPSGGLTQTSRPQKSQRTLSPGWRWVTGRSEPAHSRGIGETL
jgi:hypothetical protein